jgi:thioredoxin-related protein
MKNLIMQKTLFIIVLLLSVQLLNANEITWVKSYKEAEELAQKENKRILVLLTSKSCRWCRKLEHTTLESSSIVERINQKYIAVNLKRCKDDFPTYLKAPIVPFSYFLSSEGRVIVKTPGYWNEEDYNSFLDDVDRKVKYNR